MKAAGARQRTRLAAEQLARLARPRVPLNVARPYGPITNRVGPASAIASRRLRGISQRLPSCAPKPRGLSRDDPMTVDDRRRMRSGAAHDATSQTAATASVQTWSRQGG